MIYKIVIQLLLFFITAFLSTANAQQSPDPRFALIVGNSKYQNSPLKNSTNDAKSVAESLRQLGFKVEELIDADAATMKAAIENFKSKISEKKGVGFFYFAGHAVQSEWKNYLIPIGAKIKNVTDIPEEAVSVQSILSALKQANARLSIVVLDSCRDNPFSKDAAVRGMALQDAPPNTLIAYATKSGEVAEDGEDSESNGLYTSHMLNELKKPYARLEDVFRRVSLEVSQITHGRQIPTDVHNLDEPFFFDVGFIKIKPPSSSERETKFAEEKAHWNRIKNSTDNKDFYDFLKMYPSGFISELASYKLNQLLPNSNEFTANQNSAKKNSMNKRFRLGDIYEFSFKDIFSGVEKRRETFKVTRIDGDKVEINDGKYSYTQSGGDTRSEEGDWTYDPPFMTLPATKDDYIVGKDFVTRTDAKNLNRNLQFWLELQTRVVKKEKFMTNLGELDAFQLESISSSPRGIMGYYTRINSPDWGLSLKLTFRNSGSQGGYIREVVRLQRGLE